MTTQEKKALRAQYPKKLTLDNVRCILHISKRKASWLLANGYIIIFYIKSEKALYIIFI